MAEALSAEQVAGFRAAIDTTWNLPVHVEKYLVYDDPFRDFFAASGELALEALSPQPGDAVVDIAAGTGLLTLELARRVGPSGRVHATDISTAFVELIEAKAAGAGFANVTATHQDVHDLHDDDAFDAAFDGALCRFGIMYFADPIGALRAVRGALRPGGRFAAVVWTDPAQPLFAATFGTLPRHATMPAPVPGAPSPFRYAAAGSAGADLEQAGFERVSETTHTVTGRWPFGGAEIWDFFTGAVPAVLATLEPAARQRLDEEVIAALEQHRAGDGLEIPMTFHVVVGHAPAAG